MNVQALGYSDQPPQITVTIAKGSNQIHKEPPSPSELVSIWFNAGFPTIWVM